MQMSPLITSTFHLSVLTGAVAKWIPLIPWGGVAEHLNFLLLWNSVMSGLTFRSITEYFFQLVSYFLQG